MKFENDPSCQFLCGVCDGLDLSSEHAIVSFVSANVRRFMSILCPGETVHIIQSNVLFRGHGVIDTALDYAPVIKNRVCLRYSAHGVDMEVIHFFILRPEMLLIHFESAPSTTETFFYTMWRIVTRVIRRAMRVRLGEMIARLTYSHLISVGNSEKRVRRLKRECEKVKKEFSLCHDRYDIFVDEMCTATLLTQHVFECSFNERKPCFERLAQALVYG